MAEYTNFGQGDKTKLTNSEHKVMRLLAARRRAFQDGDIKR